MKTLLAALLIALSAMAQNTPVIALVANAEGEAPVISPNTWIEIKGSGLAKTNDSRIWQSSDFVNNQMPTKLDGVSVTVNGKSAFVYYISATQINVLTPPDALPASVQVVVTNGNNTSAPFSVKAQAMSPSFFMFDAARHIAATHVDGSLLGPTDLFPGASTAAKPGETVVLYANGFGPTSAAVISGSVTQSGTLSPLPEITVGGVKATVVFAGLVAPGEFQFNVVLPSNLPNGDNALVAAYNGTEALPVSFLTVQGSGALPTALTLFVAPNGNDTWSGRLASPNPNNTDGPLATMDGARSMVQAAKTGLANVMVQFRGGTYPLAATVKFSAADSGSPNQSIVYQNYPGETPVLSGGVRVANWTNVGGNTWKTTLPASTQYFENLYYNSARRLRPRLGGYLGAFYRYAASVFVSGPPSKSPDPNCSVYVEGSGWECFDRFQYDPKDPITNVWKNLAPSEGNPCGQPAGNPVLNGDVVILAWQQFSTSKLRVSCVDPSNHIVYLTGTTAVNPTRSQFSSFTPGYRYLVENVQDALTQPGQFFVDHSTTPWTLTYLASAGENPNNDIVMVPQLPQLLIANGLQYVTFQGLTFEHDNYVLPANGHKSSEMEPGVSSAISFQNAQHITFDSNIVTQIAGTGLSFVSCVNAASSNDCIATSSTAATANNLIQNSAFYDIGALGVLIGNSYTAADTDANIPQFNIVQNNVVEGYGRVIPAAFGIGQGNGHDNLYTHNDVYDGYHTAVSISESTSDQVKPSPLANANNTISFNHVYDLFQGIMNDGGAIRIEAGNSVYTAPGNKILNNKIHDVTDASVMDRDGYGGHGIYLDNQTGLVDVENNLVYRVSAANMHTPQGPAAPNEASTIKNNIFAYGRGGIVDITNPYTNGVPPAIPLVFNLTNNLVYFDRDNTSTPKFFVQGGCIYAGGVPYTQFMFFDFNLYWRTDGAFASENKAFAVQPNPDHSGASPCSQNTNLWTFYTFAQWQKLGEDIHGTVANPGFANPAHPADDYSLPKGSPGVGFVVFDPNQAGRTHPVIKPPAIAPTFPTKPFNPATDY